MEVLVESGNLVVEREEIPAVTEVVFDKETYRFLSWVIRLVRMLSVNISKTY